MSENKIFTLSTGREINFDFSDITRKEFRKMFEVNQPTKEGDESVFKITGLTSEEQDNLNQLDWVSLVREIIVRANRPNPI
jgi:hypothetical protein